MVSPRQREQSERGKRVRRAMPCILAGCEKPVSQSKSNASTTLHFVERFVSQREVQSVVTPHYVRQPWRDYGELRPFAEFSWLAIDVPLSLSGWPPPHHQPHTAQTRFSIPRGSKLSSFLRFPMISLDSGYGPFCRGAVTDWDALGAMLIDTFAFKFP